MEIFEEFTIEAAHRLPQVPAGHKCARLHGHSFRIALHVRGAVDETTGWVMDFAELNQAFAPLHEQLDHRLLTASADLESPTGARLPRWICPRLKPGPPGLSQIVLRETCTAGCVYRGEG